MVVWVGLRISLLCVDLVKHGGECDKRREAVTPANLPTAAHPPQDAPDIMHHALPLTLPIMWFQIV